MAIKLKPSAKRGAYYVTLILVFYWLFIRPRNITETFEVTLPGVDPKTVWEFWADFSNYKKINPTVLDFEIDYERGTYENWEYGVTYTEHLTRLPLINAVLKGRFIVTPMQRKGHFKEPFRIMSEHDCCVFTVFCSQTNADMTFSASGGDNGGTVVMEKVYFQVPIMFTWFYLNEFRTQRQYISDRLKSIDFNSV